MKLNFKLGRKKADNAAGEEYAPAETARPSKAKAAKSGSGAKQWLFQNVEKLVCGLTLLLLGWLVYGALGKLEPTPGQTPSDLKARAKAVKDKALASVIADDRYPMPDYISAVSHAVEPIAADRYAFPALSGPVLVPIGKRRDPELYPVRDLIARAGSGVFLVKTRDPELKGIGVTGGAEQQKPLPANLQLPGVAPSDADALTEGRRWIVIHALLPYQEQLDEYNRCFANSHGYNRQRDLPQYIDARIQRLEIKPGMNPQNLDWSQATQWGFREWMVETRRQQSVWTKFADELIDPRYVEKTTQGASPLSLTKPLGPLAFESWKPWAAHPQVPLAPPRPKVDPAARDRKRFGGGAAAARPVAPPPATPAPAAAPGGGGGVADIFGPPPTEPADEPAAEEAAPEEESQGPAEPGAGETVKYRLVRIFDFGVEPGKSYRYKIQLAVYNPNRKDLNIPLRLLEKPETVDQTYRETPWSESSPTVHVPADAQLFAGSIRAASNDSPERMADVVVRILDITKGRMSHSQLGLRLGGMVRDKTRSFEVDPANRKAVAYDGAEVMTDYTLIDMRGSGSGMGQHTDGQLLFMDAQGNLIVRDAAADRDAVDQYNQLEEIFSAAPAKPKAGAAEKDPKDEESNPLFKAKDDAKKKEAKKKEDAKKERERRAR